MVENKCSAVPVLITVSLTWTPFVALIWIPSVLGLKAGANTLRWEARTLIQLVNDKCICWLFISIRFLIVRSLHLWKVRACSVNVVSYSANKTHNRYQMRETDLVFSIFEASLTVGAGWHGCERTFWSHFSYTVD